MKDLLVLLTIPQGSEKKCCIFQEFHIGKLLSRHISAEITLEEQCTCEGVENALELGESEAVAH